MQIDLTNASPHANEAVKKPKAEQTKVTENTNNSQNLGDSWVKVEPDDFQNASQKLQDHQKRLDDIQTNIESAKDKNASLKKQTEDLKKGFADLQAKIPELKKKVDNVDAAKQQCEQSKKELDNNWLYRAENLGVNIFFGFIKVNIYAFSSIYNHITMENTKKVYTFFKPAMAYTASCAFVAGKEVVKMGANLFFQCIDISAEFLCEHLTLDNIDKCITPLVQGASACTMKILTIENTKKVYTFFKPVMAYTASCAFVAGKEVVKMGANISFQCIDISAEFLCKHVTFDNIGKCITPLVQGASAYTMKMMSTAANSMLVACNKACKQEYAEITALCKEVTKIMCEKLYAGLGYQGHDV